MYVCMYACVRACVYVCVWRTAAQPFKESEKLIHVCKTSQPAMVTATAARPSSSVAVVMTFLDLRVFFRRRAFVDRACRAHRHDVR